MLLMDYKGWTPSAQVLFEQAGGLAAGVRDLFDGTTSRQRQDAKELVAKQKEAAESANNASIIKSTQKMKVFEFVQKNWLYFLLGGLALLIIIFWKPLMKLLGIRGKKNRVRHYRTVNRVVTSRRSKGRSRNSSSGFKRKIHGKTYTSAKSWANAMRNLRKK